MGLPVRGGRRRRGAARPQCGRISEEVQERSLIRPASFEYYQPLSRTGESFVALAAWRENLPSMDTEGLPRMREEMILETADLTKEFAGFVAVNGVSLRVRRGTIHALIGPNGAGKTTCFNLLTKFLSPTHGRILFKGQDITDMQPADVARLGLVRSFQISAVFPHMTVL